MAGNKPAGAIVGFANFLLRLFEAEQPRAVVVGWDTLEAPTYRHKAFPAYQSGRQFDKELLQQFPRLREFVSACGFINARAPGYEADDFLAAAVALATKRRMKTVVASGDRDTFQLASEFSTILYPVRAGELARIGPEQVVERYRVLPVQVPDFIALRGDPSDRLPGAKGVGEVGAAALLLQFGTLEGVLEGRTLRARGGPTPIVSSHRYDGCQGAVAAGPANQADMGADLGQSRGAGAGMEAWSACRAARSPFRVA